LDSAYTDALSASGPNFLRRLGDYCRLFEDDPMISPAVAQLRKEVREAGGRLTREDEEAAVGLTDDAAADVENAGRSWWENPWVVGIGVTVIGTVVAGLIVAALLGSQ
jgi:hypothetical protein